MAVHHTPIVAQRSAPPGIVLHPRRAGFEVTRAPTGVRVRQDPGVWRTGR